MAFFNKPSDLPVDQVKALRSRGFDNNQIVQALQRNGYTSSQIFDALNQADLVNAAPVQDVFQASPPPQQPIEQAPVYAEQQPAGQSTEEIEEMVESVIEEKWESISKDIIKIVDWKSDIEGRITRLEQKVEGMRGEFDKLHQAIIGKIGEYDKNILSVGAEIKAMEKVFSKVLPVFMENVSELDRITKELKK